jgi:excisionase family DNA binding protein
MCQQAKSKKKQPASQFLSVTETAIILNVSRKMVYQWIQEGRLAAFRVGKNARTTRISKSDLEEFIRNNTIPPKSYTLTKSPSQE